MSKSTKKDTNVAVSKHVTDDMLSKVEEIQELVKVRSALAYGTSTDIRTRAQGVMSRTISKEVDVLSQMILKEIKE